MGTLHPIATQLDRQEYLLIGRQSGPDGEEYVTSCLRGLNRALHHAQEMNRLGWTVEIQGTGGSDYRRTYHAQ